MNNKTIVLENKKFNIKDMFILRTSSINTIYDINKDSINVVDKYYLYESFDGHLLVFANYDVDTNSDENESLEILINYFLDLNKKDNTFIEYLARFEKPSIIYIEKDEHQNPQYQLVNYPEMYYEIIDRSPQYILSQVVEYCKEALYEEDDYLGDDETVKHLNRQDILVGQVDKTNGTIISISEEIDSLL